MAHAPVIIACASTYWRNAWKYQARAYRHCFWDSGTMLANLLAVAAADARAVARRLWFRRRCGECAARSRSAARGAARTGGARLRARRLRRRVRRCRRSRWRRCRCRRAKSTTPRSARCRRRHRCRRPRKCVRGASMPVAAPASLQPVRQSCAAAPARRRRCCRPSRSMASSSRRGSTRAVRARADHVRAALDDPRNAALAVLPATTVRRRTDLYLIVNAVEGLAPGTYVYHRDRAGARAACVPATFAARRAISGSARTCPPTRA